MDFICEIRPADVPDLVRLARVLLPLVARESAIETFKSTAVSTEQFVATAIAVEEIQPRAAIQLVIARTAERAFEPRVFEDVGSRGSINVHHAAVERAVVVQVAVGVAQHARLVHEDTELHIARRQRIARPRIKLVPSLTAQHIVMALASKDAVEIGCRSFANFISPKPVISSQAEQRVTAHAAIQPVTPRSAGQRVVTRSAIQHRDPI